jgi:tetratricopeptide (TPR) repeat protein
MEQVTKKEHIRLIYLTLTIATLIVFGQVCRNGFVGYDDPFYLTNNSHVKYGISLESIIWAFTTTLGANWHPLTWLSHMLDCQLFGLNPLWHHLTSVLFHIANTLLLFWILKRMTGKIWASAFVAAAFALHPLHVESVAWAAERKDVLSGLFWMLTIASYIRYTEHPSLGRYLPVFLVFGVGLMAKPMLVTLPFVLFLLDYWPLGRFQWGRSFGHQRRPAWRLIVEKIPLFILSAALSIVTYVIQQSAGAMELGKSYPLNIRISNAAVSYIAYIGKLIYPSRLAVLYPYPGDSLPLWQPIVSLLILVVISAGVIYTAKRYLATGWFWYIGTLVPVIGLVQIGNQMMADRYTYLPSIGIFIMVAWGAAELVARWRYRETMLGICAGIVLTALSICTLLQVRYWRNGSTLYERAILVTENNYIMHCNYGTSLSEEGLDDEALKHLGVALQINPRYYYVHYGIGTVLLKQEKFAEAIECFNKAIRFKPDYHKAYSDLGVALSRQGKTDQAIENWKRALSLKPDYYPASYNIGAAMIEQGRYEDSINYFNAAVKAKPDWAEAYYEMGRAFYLQGNRESAVEQCTKALQIKPDYTIARITLAHTLAEMGRIQPAIEHYYTVLKLEPDQVYALKNLAWLLATIEDTRIHNPGEAVKLAEKACELTGYKEVEALDTLAIAYSAAGRYPEAVQIAEKAIEFAISSGEEEMAKKIQKRLELYKADKFYRLLQPLEKVEGLKKEGTIKTDWE